MANDKNSSKVSEDKDNSPEEAEVSKDVPSEDAKVETAESQEDGGVETLEGRTVGMDNFVTIDGKALQHGSRENLRPFNGEELRRILRVGLCLQCHKQYDDPVYKEYRPERPCPVYKEP